MPKDATKNIDRYKIRGGQLNEFEYTENQKALAGKKAKGGAELIPGTPPEEADEGLDPRVTAKASGTTKGTKASATTKSTKAAKATKATKSAKVNSSKRATAKKQASRKAAKHNATKAKP